MIKRFDIGDLVIFKTAYGRLLCELGSVAADGRSVRLHPCESRNVRGSGSVGPMSALTLAERVLRGDIIHVHLRICDYAGSALGLSWRQFVELKLQTALRRAARLEHRGRIEVLSAEGLRFGGTASPFSAAQPFETPAELWRKGCASNEEGGR